MKQSKIKFFKGEKVAIMRWKKTAKGLRYAVTNFGRVISFTSEVKTGNLLSPTSLSGYPGVSVPFNGTPKNMNVHRLVALYFLKKPSPKHNKVVHLNYKKNDNHYKNLKWVTFLGQAAHTYANPDFHNKGGNVKLTEAQVRKIKEALQKGKSTLKSLAQKFKVSDMQIHRIRTGENWSKIKI
jgi:hypothetical protein